MAKTDWQTGDIGLDKSINEVFLVLENNRLMWLNNGAVSIFTLDGCMFSKTVRVGTLRDTKAIWLKHLNNETEE